MSSPVDHVLDELKMQNREWVKEVNAQDPTFFKNSAKSQQPKVLWIGCSDSRVPESVLLKCMPGAIFTHRNIANQIFASDANAISVITYALLELEVEHIVIAGHSNCGGVAVCIDQHLTAEEKACCFEPKQSASWPPPPPIDRWLAELRSLAQSMHPPPSVLELVKINVQQQLKKVIALPVVQEAWEGRGIGSLKGVHGWWYELETGLVHDMDISVHAPQK